jgi:hypothetical protein
MASTSILRSRRSVGQLHAIAGVEREIRATDPAGESKYVRDFRDAYSTYEKVVNRADIRNQIARSGIVLVSDYHALPNSQRYLASLLNDSALHRRPLVLGVETIFTRDQSILDEWVRGDIDEDELRERVRFDLDWGYDWAPFYELLCAARDNCASIYGLDCMPRDDMRKIAARDRHAADKIAELRNRHPDALILVLFGESHLAPGHLPSLIGKRLGDAKSAETRVLTILQNVDALYWKAAGEANDNIEAVEVSDDVLCVFNATPLEKYENYRLCLDRWAREDNSAPDLGPTLYNLINGMVRFLGIDQYSPHNSTQPRLLVDLMPEVYSPDSDAMLNRLLSRKGFKDADRSAMFRQVMERGSAYLAPLNTMYVRQFRMASAAEDASRFLHHACRALPNWNLAHRNPPSKASQDIQALKLQEPDSSDVFYTAVLEHALAFFGSRVLHPTRPAFRDADLVEMYDLTREDLELQTDLPFADAVDALDVLSSIRDFNRNNLRGAGSTAKSHSDPAGIARVMAFTGRKYAHVTEQLGYLIGNDLYEAYVHGRIAPAAIRKFFLAHLDEPGAAQENYQQLIRRT